MQAIVWIISGLLAGWLARVVMKERRIGFLADFTLGTLGGELAARSRRQEVQRIWWWRYLARWFWLVLRG
jgi:uncharacterized membrane protein YeaQ/YmgE (transglycosylase-associated protein family)